MQTIYLDISNKGVVPTIYAKQGDVGRKFAVSITNNGIAYQIEDDSVISVWYDGASGSGNYKDIEDESAVYVSGNKITVKMIAQMLVNAGNGNVCLVIKTADGEEIGTWNIPYEVEARAGVGSKPAHDNHVIITQLDPTLSVEGMAADAAAVGEALKKIPKSTENVKYTPQQLDELQKAQARENIGAAKAGADGSIVPDVVMYTKQTLTEGQKAQAKENIDASTYYHTEREEVKATHDEIDTEYIYDLYDALGLQGTKLADVRYKDEAGVAHTLPIKEYVISTGERNTEGVFGERYTADPQIKKPVYLIQSAIHGQERKTAFSVYKFIRDLLNGHNVPKAFKEGAIIKVIPVVNPSGFDAFSMNNANGENINRDFIVGATHTPQVETQTIIDWLESNRNAELFIDVHNSGQVNEVAAIFGAENSDVADMAKEIALRGIDRVIPYWDDVIGYPEVEAPTDFYGNETTVQDVIFSYTASSNEELETSAFYYATKTLGIPALAVELSTYYGDYSDWVADKTSYPAETIAAGAEVIGNILIEFYEQSFFGEVNEDMKQIDSKLDGLDEKVVDVDGKLNALMQSVNSGFRVESGVYTVGENITATQKIQIPCSNGAKAFEFYADEETLARIKATTGTRYIGACAFKYSDKVRALSGGMQVKQYGVKAELCEMQDKTADGFGWVLFHDTTSFENTSGVKITARAQLAGTYNWKAYYWNE